MRKKGGSAAIVFRFGTFDFQCTRHITILILNIRRYVGADLMSLCRESAMRAVTRMFDIAKDTTNISKSIIYSYINSFSSISL